MIICFRSENFSSLGYTLPRGQSKGHLNGSQTVTVNSNSKSQNPYWTNGTPQESSTTPQNWVNLKNAYRFSQARQAEYILHASSVFTRMI